MKNSKWIHFFVWFCFTLTVGLVGSAAYGIHNVISERKSVITNHNLDNGQNLDLSKTVILTLSEIDSLKQSPVPDLNRLVSGFAACLLYILFIFLFNSKDLVTDEKTDYSLLFFALAFSAWALPLTPSDNDYAAILNTAFLIPAYWGLDIKPNFIKSFEHKITLFQVIAFSFVVFIIILILQVSHSNDFPVIIDQIISIVLFVMLGISFFKTFHERFSNVSSRKINYTGTIMGALLSIPCILYLVLYGIDFTEKNSSIENSYKLTLLLIAQLTFILSVLYLAFSWAYSRARIANQLLFIQSVQIKHYGRNMLSRLVANLEDRIKYNALNTEEAINTVRDFKSHYDLSEVMGGKVKINFPKRIHELFEDTEKIYSSFQREITFINSEYNSEICVLFISILNELMINAHKHGGGIGRVVIIETPNQMKLEVENLTNQWPDNKSHGKENLISQLSSQHQGMHIMRWYARAIDSSYSLEYKGKTISFTFNKIRFI